MSSWDTDYRYEPASLYKQIFRCLPFDKYKNPELETGNKIIMPQSALSLLLSLPVRYPLFFKIGSFSSDKTSYCSVLEFGDEEGFVYMPQWMMKNLDVEEGACVVFSDAALSKGVYMKLQPHATAFVEVSNPRAVLETALRGFACVSCGDTIMVRYNERDFYLDVLDVRPGGEAVSLIETDCVLEFAPPLDYVEPLRREAEGDGGEQQKMDEAGEERKKRNEREEEREGVKEFRPFMGVARRLDESVGMLESGGCSAVAGGPTTVAVDEGRKREKVGGKINCRVKKVGGDREEVREFRPFAGVARRLGGTVESSRCSAVAGGPAGASAEEAKKREKGGGKDEAKEKFKPFTGRGRVLGGPFFD